MDIIQDPDPILFKRARDVRADEMRDVRVKARKVLEGLRKYKHGNVRGVGLSANQVGDLRRWFVSQIFGVVINPVVLKVSEEQVWAEEMCLSKPGFKKKIKRPLWIKVQWVGKKSKPVHRRIEQVPARIFLHELDHLNGVNIWGNLLNTVVGKLRKSDSVEVD